MKREIQNVITEWPIGLAQYRVVEQVRQRGEWPVDAGFTHGPPICVMKDKADVLPGSGADARIQQETFVVKDKSGFE
jgi:hypothetical protein